MGIQNYFIHKKIKSTVSGKKPQDNTAELSKIRKVAIIVDELSSFNDSYFKKLQKLMQLDDTHFQILTIKHKKSNYNEFKGVVLFTNEVNWKGDFTSPEIKDYLNTSYDLLIDFIPENSSLKQLIVSKVHAIMKVGFGKNNPDLYNMTVKVEPTEIEISINELVKYLNILKVL